MELIFLIFLMVAINAIVTIVIAAVIRSKVLCVFTSVVVTESIFALYGLIQAAHSNDVYDILLAVNITGMVSTPIIIGTSVGFNVLARRLYGKPAIRTDV